MSNQNLHKAHKAKNDEFYTQLSDIEKELQHYKAHFKDKVVLCNCDDPEESNFWKYFSMNFEYLGLKKLISTHFDPAEPSYKLELCRDTNGDGRVNQLDTIKTPLKQNGDFRSPECIDIMKEADIVVTNPPFSLFREFIDLLIKHNKQFLVIGNMNAITYKDIFSLIKENKLWVGVNFNKTMEFQLPIEYEKYSRIDDKGNKYGKVPAICWYTNLSHSQRREKLVLYKKYTQEEYPKYDNYEAINVDSVKEIPLDYQGVMGIPITFLNVYNPLQFELIGSNRGIDQDPQGVYGRSTYLNGKETFKRLFIKRKV